MTTRETYRLRQSIDDAGTTIEEVSVRPLRIGDLRALEIKMQGDGCYILSVGSLLDCAAAALGWDPGLVDKLAIDDAVAIGALIAKGFPGLPA